MGNCTDVVFCVQDPRLATYGGFSRTHPPSVPGALDDIGTAVPFPTNDAGADVSWAPKPMLEFRVGFNPTDPVSPLFSPVPVASALELFRTRLIFR